MNRIKSVFIATAAATAFLMSTSSALVAEMAKPTGTPILTVSGDVDNDTVAFDLEMLQTLEATTFSTTTIWSEGEQTFTGVPVTDLVQAVGGTGNTPHATAINDYSVEINLSDASTEGAIIAYHLNGQPMSVRDKGPLWVVYPFDQGPEYRTESVYARSIWQLDRIEIVE